MSHSTSLSVVFRSPWKPRQQSQKTVLLLQLICYAGTCEKKRTSILKKLLGSLGEINPKTSLVLINKIIMFTKTPGGPQRYTGWEWVLYPLTRKSISLHLRLKEWQFSLSFCLQLITLTGALISLDITKPNLITVLLNINACSLTANNTKRTNLTWSPLEIMHLDMIIVFIKSILKSLVILAIWLALSGAIYSRIAPFFALNRIFSSANENGTVKQNNQSDSKVLLR